MSENEKEFRKLVAGLKIDATPNPAHREQLRRQMLATFEQSKIKSGIVKAEGLGDGLTHIQRSHRQASLDDATHHSRWLLNSTVGRFAVAAAILIAATIGAWGLFGRWGPTTFGQVRAATQKMPWLHAAVSRYQNGQVRTEHHWYNFAARAAYVVTDDGAVIGWEYGDKQEKLAYNPRVRTLAISDLSGAGLFGADSAYTLVDAFAVFAAKDDVKVGKSTVQREGRTVQAFGIETAEPGFDLDGKPVAGLKITLCADARTRRAIAASVEYRSASDSVLAAEEWVMSYPQSGPASVYDLGVPASASVADSRRGHIGTPGFEPSPTSTPPPTSGFRLAPVEIRLPKPMFVGTPQSTRTPNLERPRGGPRPPFLAPVGTTNVAFGKPVSSSDQAPVIGNLEMVTDGDKEADEGSVVELSPGPQYVTIDLQERCDIYAAVVWHYHRWPRTYFDVVVQVSDDPTFKTGVKTIFNTDIDNSLGRGAGKDLFYVETYEGKLLDGKGSQGRYVRLFSNGNTHDELNHYTEVEVYGRPLNRSGMIDN